MYTFLRVAFTRVSLGNSNLPTARDLLRQAEATLTKAITDHLEWVNEASNANLKESVMDGWAANRIALHAIAQSGPFLGITRLKPGQALKA